MPFPYVSDDIDKELNDWKNDYESMGHKKLNKDVFILHKIDLFIKFLKVQ